MFRLYVLREGLSINSPTFLEALSFQEGDADPPSIGARANYLPRHDMCDMITCWKPRLAPLSACVLQGVM